MDDRLFSRYAPLPLRPPLTPPFGASLLVSVLAHALVLALSEGPRQPPIAASAKPLRISLKLLPEGPSPQAAIPLAKPRAAPLPRRAGPRRLAIAPPPMRPATTRTEAPTPIVAEAAGSRKVASVDPAPQSVHSPAAVAAAPTSPARSAADDAASLAAYTRALSDAVAPHRQYPGIARIRGWQGTTLVEVHVGGAGKVVGTRISRSSGHEVLDRQAVAMIYRAEPLPVLPGLGEAEVLGERQVLVRLPIQFSLVD